MRHVLKHFSIADITHHAEIDSLTGKVKFQFSDSARASDGIEDYIIIDVVIAASKDDTLETIKDSLLDKAASILQSALTAIHQIDDQPPITTEAPKLH